MKDGFARRWEISLMGLWWYLVIEREIADHTLGKWFAAGLKRGYYCSKLELEEGVLHKYLAREEGSVEGVEKLDVAHCSGVAAGGVAAVVVVVDADEALVVGDFAVGRPQKIPWKLGRGED